MAILDQVPASFVAGDSWRWLRGLGDYPATTYTVTWYFENGAFNFNAVGTASGTSHSVTIAAATTSAYTPGRYRWYARAVDIATGLIKEIVKDEDGWLDVIADPAAAGNFDRRTWARRTLEALEATIEGRASQDQLSMSVAGRSISRLSPTELMQWRTELKKEVANDEKGQGPGSLGPLLVRLVRG